MDDLEIWEYEKAFPRAWLVDEYQVIESPDAMLDAIRSEDFDPARVALLEEELLGEPPEPMGTEIGSVRFAGITENTITFDVEAQHDAILVVSDAYYPGWRAEISGEGAFVFPVFSVMRGIQIPEGRYTVEFVYDPPSFRNGLRISVLVLLLSAIVAGFKIRRLRSAKS